MISAFGQSIITSRCVNTWGGVGQFVPHLTRNRRFSCEFDPHPKFR